MNVLEDVGAVAANAVVPGSGVLVKVGGFISRHGPGILMALVSVALAGLLYWAPWAVSRGAHSRDLEVAGLQKTIADMKAADAKATAEAEAKARAVEGAQTQAKEGSNHEIQDMRDRALALATARLAQLHQPAQAGTAAAGVGEAANAGGGAGLAPAGSGSMPIMDDDDLRICTENTVKALSWSRWWLKIQAIQR